jgi:GTPase
MIEKKIIGCRAALIHIDIDQPFNQAVVLESQALIAAAQMQLICVMSVQLKGLHPKSLLSVGLLGALQAVVQTLECDVLVIDYALEGKHHRYLERAFCCAVMDRTELILHLFSARARSYEGKLQVQLAQCSFQATRLVRQWTHLERQRGGIGVRGGPGEKQLETDKRLLNKQIKSLRSRVDKVRKQRALSRSARMRHAVPIVALVGYTNAGKSSLFNRLTGADAFQDNQVFATLDPMMRQMTLPGLGQVICIDTVGFIRELPPMLLEAFKATLEEVTTADLLVHVVDISEAEHHHYQQVTQEVLHLIDAGDKPQLLVYNKMDLLAAKDCRRARACIEHASDDDAQVLRTCWVSAQQDKDLSLLKQSIARLLQLDRVEHHLVLSLAQGALRSVCYAKGWVVHEALLARNRGWRLTLSLSMADQRLLDKKIKQQ